MNDKLAPKEKKLLLVFLVGVLIFSLSLMITITLQEFNTINEAEETCEDGGYDFVNYVNKYRTSNGVRYVECCKVNNDCAWLRMGGT